MVRQNVLPYLFSNAANQPCCRPRCACNNSIPAHSPILPVVHFAPVRQLFLLSLRTALSATPFVSERWRVLMSRLDMLQETLVNCLCKVFRLLWRRKKSLKTRHCFRCFFRFHRTTLNPLVKSSGSIRAFFVSASRLVFHVQNFMICRDQVSEFCRKCNPVHALLRFYPTAGSCCFCLLTDFTLGIFRIMSETHCGFLLAGNRWFLSYSWCLLPEYLPPHRWHPREVYHQEVLLRQTCSRVTPSFWSRRRYYFHSFCTWLQQIQHGVLHFSLKISFGWRDFNGWHSFLKW